MYFARTQRHSPKRNEFPISPTRDETARRHLARMAVDLEDLRRQMEIQVTRSGQLQAELDEIKQLLKSLKPGR
jgi:hypothetical protein